MRLAWLGRVQYREDDDELWTIVTRMAHSGQVPLTGMHSSIGLPNGPFQALLLAPFGWVDAAPPLMTAGVALLNVLGLALLYGFAREFFGRRVAALTVLLAAVNPWAVVLSRRLWGDDMVAPFAVLALWMLCRWLCHGRDRALPMAAAALAVVSQVYIVGLECLVTAVLALALGIRRLRTRWAVAALVVLLALSGPYAVGAALPRLHALGSIDAPPPGAPARLDLTPARLALELAGGNGYQAFALQAGGRLDATSGLPAALSDLAEALYLLGLGLGLRAVVTSPSRATHASPLPGAWLPPAMAAKADRPPIAAPRAVHLLLLVWVVVPVAALLRHSAAVPVYPYYLATTFPAPALYPALAVVGLWRAARRRQGTLGRALRWAVGGLAAAIPAAWCLLGAVFFAVIGEYWPASVYGMPWSMSDHLVQQTLQLQRQTGAARVLVPQHNQELSVLYRLLAARGAPVAEFDDQRMVILPARPTVYLAVGDDAPAQRFLLATERGALVREERLPGAGVVARWYLLPGAAASATMPAGATPLPWTFSEGGRPLARLAGLVLPARAQPGQGVSVTAVTDALAQPGAEVPDFSLYVHLLDPSGRQLAQADAAVWPSRFWQPGDRMLQWLPLTLPAGPAPDLLRASLGMYSVGVSDGAIHPLQVLDADGKAAPSADGPALAIPPPVPAAPSHPLAARFAEGIALDGYDLVQDGGTLRVTLHWAASGTPSRDLTAYVHVLDAAGRLVAQHDGPPAGGAFPTSRWQADDRLADAHTVPLPAGLPAGTYRLEFGLYDPSTLHRLAVLSGQAGGAVTLAAQ